VTVVGTGRLTDTPQIQGAVRKAKSRRGHAAFAELTVDVLLEVGLHKSARGGLTDRGLGAGQRVEGGTTGAGGRGASPGPAGEFCQSAGSVCARCG